MNSASKTHLPSLGMLLLSGGGAFMALMSAAGLAVFGLINYLQGAKGLNDSQAMFSLACTAGFISVLLLPSTVLAAIRLLEKPLPVLHFPWFFRAANFGLLFVPLLIGLGFVVTKNANLAVLLLPWIQLAVVALPIWWILETGRKNLDTASSQHNWGLFSFSALVTMPLIMVLEMLLVGGIIVGVIIYIYLTSPEILQQLSTTANRLTNSSMDSETVLRILRPYVSNPGVFYFLIAIMAGVIPLLEELFKPLALWFFCAKPLSPRDGFIGGMICGAAFAMLESLFALGSPDADSWAIIAIGRVGTGILHVSASGLVGWGLAKAWSEGKYFTLIGSYLLAAIFHAMWNTSALLSGLRELAQFFPLSFGWFEGLIVVSPIFLVLLAIGLVYWVIKVNRYFQHQVKDGEN